MIAVAAAIHLREIMAGPGLAAALWLVQAYSARDHSRCQFRNLIDFRQR
jgi:hypothetical protein